MNAPHTTTLSALENNVTELTGRAVLDDAYKPALQAALERLDKARRDIKERQAFDDARAAEVAEANERRAVRAREQRIAANTRLADLDAAYRQAAIDCALAFRAVLDQVEKNNRVPGAIVEHTVGPDFKHLNQDFNGPFTTGQMMALGKQHWELTLAARKAAGMEVAP